jgi:hypothetical protein
MGDVLLTVNVVYFLFGATVYTGTMWALQFFFYPSWTKVNVDNVQDHFVVPTSAATRFFLVVVPIMFVSGAVMVVTEWGEGWTLVAAILAFLGIVESTFVGWMLIIPINRKIRDGVADDAALQPLLKRWMKLNTLRLFTVTIMWGATVWYLIAEGSFVDHVG